ncbi:adhesion G protein-coupled receptor F5 isoform X2 [Salmo salar]|uniref:Adhesion G protein-coupled receptor F5 isoform X2 n=1 Tax=Salmo salar TaxID=8030 RepID=A0A1S3S901_SALSA|nr:adhesion G protein-coupled receptor F5-like isoform X2 [Salmo salar]|eukprot:XP_014060817.1 PREDICTED: adhesion G protein-coupled receptor F5-like isoform X2 [Salmo salar]
MASPKTVWYFSVLLVLCCSLEKQDCLETPNVTSEESPTDGSQVPSREKLEGTATLYEKVGVVQLDIYNIPLEVIDYQKSHVKNVTYPILISNELFVTDINITTECSSGSTGFSCRCEDQYSCSCDHCSSYGSCDEIVSEICGCLKDYHSEVMFCRPITKPSTIYGRIIEIELDMPNISATLIDVLRASVNDLTYPVLISNVLNVTDVNFTTACYPNSTCRCEDQYGWSCDQCLSYGSCDNITDDSCGCIKAIPPYGPFCQPITKNTLNLQFTMDITFDSNFNDENNAMFKDIDQTIKVIYKRNMQGFISAKLNSLKRGSVIADFTVMTTIVNNVEIAKAKEDIVSTLGEKYKIRFTCLNNTIFGNGQVNEIVVAECKLDEVGQKIAICQENGSFSVLENNCVLKEIEHLFLLSQALVGTGLPVFLERLRNSTFNLRDRIVASPATISTIVNILKNVANVSRSTPINKPLMKNFLETAGVLTSNAAKASWDVLNTNLTKNESSAFLGTVETISNFLTDDFFDIETSRIILNKTTVNNSVNNLFNLNSSVLIDIPASEASYSSITIITFDSLYNVLPARKSSSLNNRVNTINGKVVLVKVNGTIKNVTFSFEVLNKTLANPQCVFWNFDGLGGWDGKGCELQSDKNDTVTCHCNHLTSFSILMSPSIPAMLRVALDLITYIGVGISMGCLVVCLIIEMLVWNAVTGNNTSYMRHVSIVNIAFSLLIADIWFIIGAAISENEEKDLLACSTATFFIHFFYLALFFWMLVSGLLLLYWTVMVFSHMSKPAMLAISFSLGYGAPLIIAVITIAVTAPGKQYIRGKDGVCWLNWTESMALWAFVIPALTIVVINLLILIVVLFKMLRRGVGDVTQPDERNALVVIARCLAILTPFFGTTWGLGVGTMTTPNNLAIHIVFAIFNSLQGLFILVFGTLLDKKIREALTGRSQVSSNRTKTTSAATSSSGLGFFRIRRRNVFNVSAAPTSSTTGASETFNT